MNSKHALAFYKFTPVSDPKAEQVRWQTLGAETALKGTILVAYEGVNGTLIGERKELEDMRWRLEERFGTMPFKWSAVEAENKGFFRFKVKLKKEIVTFGVAGLDLSNKGEHVSADTWNDLLQEPNVVVIDTRNQYEVDIGTFPGAVSPATTNFREFPAWVAENLDCEQRPKVAMFCTGGIRCEKASAYLKEQGFDDVYQLNGGILQYLEDVSADDNQWQGECFVFDQRVSVDVDLKQGTYQQCFACRHPITVEDLNSPLYETGVQCPNCAEGDAVDTKQRQRFRERQKQIELARSRGQQHIGVDPKTNS